MDRDERIRLEEFRPCLRSAQALLCQKLFI